MYLLRGGGIGRNRVYAEGRMVLSGSWEGVADLGICSVDLVMNGHGTAMDGMSNPTLSAVLINGIKLVLHRPSDTAGMFCGRPDVFFRCGGLCCAVNECFNVVLYSGFTVLRAGASEPSDMWFRCTT